MQVKSSTYDTWKAVVQLLDTVGASVLYRVDTSISKVAEAWAFIQSGSPAAPTELLIYGSFESQGPSAATFTGDFASAVAVTTSIGVSESGSL